MVFKHLGPSQFWFFQSLGVTTLTDAFDGSPNASVIQRVFVSHTLKLLCLHLELVFLLLTALVSHAFVFFKCLEEPWCDKIQNNEVGHKIVLFNVLSYVDCNIDEHLEVSVLHISLVFVSNLAILESSNIYHLWKFCFQKGSFVNNHQYCHNSAD